MQGLLDRMLRGLVAVGRLTVCWPDGTTSDYGHDETPAAAFAITTAHTVRRIVLNPGLAAGEAYMDGTMRFEEGSTLRELDLGGGVSAPVPMAVSVNADSLATWFRGVLWTLLGAIPASLLLTPRRRP